MPVFSRLAASAALVAALGASACTPIRTHQGYVVDKDLVDSVQPGTDTRDSVLATLGKPTFVSQFNDGEWYYVSRTSANFAYNNPNPKDQLTLRVRFDASGNVIAVDRTGKELIASVDPYGKKTPTLGKKRSFFDDLFGNIGQVGAGGLGGGDQGGGGGQ